MFKKVMSVIMSVVLLVSLVGFVSGCGDSMVRNGKEYETYGIIDKDETRDECVKYKPIIGNIVWGIILCETIIAPVYFFGFSCMEPERYICEK